MEHVWVEAAVDFVPSRGAVNRSADAWVPMDPSFKQVQTVPGADLTSISGVDPVQIGNAFVASGTVDPTYQWASGFDQTILQSAETQELSSIQSYVQTRLPNATTGQVFGGRTIVSQSASLLRAGLPYPVVLIGARDATLPSSLEQSITFAFGRDIDGSPLNPQTFPWASLNNREVTPSFAPATAADQAFPSPEQGDVQMAIYGNRWLSAPHARERSLITPAGRRAAQPEHTRTSAQRHQGMSWAERLRRVFNIDVRLCERCGGTARIIACIENPEVIRRILTHLTACDSLARAPPQPDLLSA